jgi:hypothetical protein
LGKGRGKEDFEPASGGPTGIKRIYFSLRRLCHRNEKYISFISAGEKAKLERRGLGGGVR